MNRWPFTEDDIAHGVRLSTCAAHEYHKAHGLGDFESSELYGIGTDLYRAMLGADLDTAERLLDEIEDRALTLKREAQP